MTQASAIQTPALGVPRLPRLARRHLVERVIEFGLLLAGCVSVFVTAGIVFVLLTESAHFFQNVSFWHFISDTVWTPLFANPRYGIAPLLCGTLMTTALALLVAIPCGTIISIWLSEFAPHRFREIVKPILELLSAVPTVVYGYFAMLFVTPVLKKMLGSLGIDLPTFNMLGPSLVMGVMIIPYVSSLSEDAMRAVPMLLREGSYAMGANRFSTAVRVIFPAALSGIGAAYVLGISRAVGETMIVAIAAGQQPNLTIDPTEPAATITAFIVQVSLGDLPHGTVQYQSIFAAGVTLFLMTLGFNILGWALRKKFRQVY